MYVLSASNGCFEILSVVLTLHAAHLSSSLRVEYTTNRFLILSTKIEKCSHLQASSGLLSESFNLIICYNFRKGQVVFFSRNFQTVNSETKFGDQLNFIMYPRYIMKLHQSSLHFQELHQSSLHFQVIDVNPTKKIINK